MKKLSFSLLYSIYLIALVFCLFLILIYTEDLLFYDPINSTSEPIIPPSFFLKRIMLISVLSSFAGLFSFFFLLNIQKEIYSIHRLILDMGRKNLSENDLNTPSFIHEFNILKEVIKASFYSMISNTNNDQLQKIQNYEKNLFQDLLPHSTNIQLKPITNIDLSIYPQKSTDNKKDLLEIVPTRNGLIFLISGFKAVDPITICYKSKIEFIMNFIKKISYLNEEEFLEHIINVIQDFPISNLYFSLGYISTQKPKFIFYNLQPMPFFVFNSKEIVEIQSSDVQSFPETNNFLEPHFYNLVKDDYLICFSNDLLSIKNISIKEFLEYWKKYLLEYSNQIESSKDIILYTLQILDNYLKKCNFIVNAKDYLSIIVIRKKI